METILHNHPRVPNRLEDREMYLAHGLSAGSYVQ